MEEIDSLLGNRNRAKIKKLKLLLSKALSLFKLNNNHNIGKVLKADKQPQLATTKTHSR